ncbi:hypothetical protein PHYBLDRAFT_143756 [Phycomyces blakesleeanus NRRL 1555(-)]|uniref:Uncharacterized protein n=1 Tax=Phycomyces blakesleeanus (strain ATCC 8743b / DSM 1359 / FGSC 10004 / NBRC 33097 / NRRL 1555) TaxID=763407 RepID=A0A162PS93_PHYB8|nr:hypothetical protein PHYBLDRAFT_143756 [Phycomyces blakesleeanus NRRL 1555(-)]OAD75507.1 hypothetical protein PHYBLDRAFT_143756 [Phycomyces blakesleeanus NRRL 1555(-)]|eukprot:XP_018293547.1 hypothetical protein PHYBLDRAFT_143756 [Phycomyces blakesleeanus NRRL 1555(-)]
MTKATKFDNVWLGPLVVTQVNQHALDGPHQWHGAIPEGEEKAVQEKDMTTRARQTEMVAQEQDQVISTVIVEPVVDVAQIPKVLVAEGVIIPPDKQSGSNTLQGLDAPMDFSAESGRTAKLERMQWWAWWLVAATL